MVTIAPQIAQNSQLGKFAPPEVDRAWTPRSGAANEFAIPMQARPPTTLPEPHATGSGNKCDLPSLIDIALSNNPDTRQTWDQARAAAAAYGVSRAPFYPVVSAQVPGGYERQIFQLPGQNAVLKQWQITPMIEFTYTLLDFGRRSAGAAAAREQLAAANFSFNRKLQDVVFATQRSFYASARRMPPCRPRNKTSSWRRPTTRPSAAASISD